MNRKIKFSIIIIVFLFVLIFLQYKIDSYDMNYYHGKDNGFVVRIESILVFSLVFFFFMSKSKVLINTIIGFFIGILAAIFSFLFLAICFENSNINIELISHVLSYIITILMFFCIEKFQLKHKT